MEFGRPVKPENISAWDPFYPLDTAGECLRAAKSGAFVSGYLAISYLINFALAYFRGKDLFGNEGLGVLFTDGIAILLAVFATWRIWTRKSFWASVLVSAWFAVEVVIRIAAFINGQQSDPPFYAIIFAPLTVSAILSIRGTWKLRSYRKAAEPEASVE